jgi:hypothetical protein
MLSRLAAKHAARLLLGAYIIFEFILTIVIESIGTF